MNLSVVRINKWFQNVMVIILSLWCIALAAQTNLAIEKLSGRINSANYDETNPLVSRDGKYLYFTRVGHPGFNRTLYQEGKDVTTYLSASDYEDLLKDVYIEITEDADHNPSTSPFNQDIWIAVSVEGEFDVIDHPGYPANNALPNSICSLTPRDDQFIVVNEFYQDGSMYKGFSVLTRHRDGSWSYPQPLHIYEMTEYSPEVNLNLSSDGEIALISMRRSDGFGENDLYVSFKLSTEKWSAPINLGPDINSGYRDITPYLSSDGRTLYFASDRPGGFGGMDIYISRRIGSDWKKWTTPKVLPPDVNSAFDDGQPFLHDNTGKLYFASTREGDSNIYRADELSILKQLDIEIDEDIKTEAKMVQQIKRDKLPENPQHVENNIAKIDPPAEEEKQIVQPLTIRCQLFNSVTGQPMDGEVAFSLLSKSTDANSVFTEKGSAEFQLVAKDFVQIIPIKSGFIAHEKIINPMNVTSRGEKVMTLTFFLDPIKEAALISLKPIYFERSKPVVLETSYTELDRLAKILAIYTYIDVEIGGHTDNIGDKSLLYQLSRDRAQAIKSYLVKKGIAPRRISTMGYGPDQLISETTDEASRALNRRVEVKITKVNNF